MKKSTKYIIGILLGTVVILPILYLKQVKIPINIPQSTKEKASVKAGELLKRMHQAAISGRRANLTPNEEKFLINFSNTYPEIHAIYLKENPRAYDGYTVGL